MFDAGALIFKLQTIGAQLFKQDQRDAEQAVEKTGTAAQGAAGKVDKLGTSTDEAGKKAKGAKAPLDDQAKATKKVGDENDSADPKIKRTTASTEQQIDAAKRLSATMLIAGTAVAAMVSLSVVKHSEFDAAMSNVRAATMATAEEQKALGEAALDAGADTAYSASEAAAAQEELAKAGLSVSEVIGGSLNGALALAAAGQLQVARSAEIMATTLKQYKLPAEDAGHVSDLLAAGAGKAQGSVDDLAQALQYVGPVAAGLGISLEETTGTLALFASQGQLGERAGTGLRGVLMSLTSPSALAAKTMAEYNVEIFNADGSMKSLAAVSQQLKTAFGGLTEAERSAALGRIFGNEQITAARVLYEGGADAVNEWTNAVDESGYAARQAAMRQDNLAGDIEKLGGALDTALIRTGAAANDVLRGMTQAITELIDMYGEAPEPIQATALVLGVVTAAVLLFAGGAVGARAKFLELQLALDKTNMSMGKTAIIGGIAGIALTGVLAIVTGLMAAQADARARAESYAEALRQTGSAADESVRGIVAANLSAKESFLWLEGDSAYDAAKKLGISMDLVTDAAEGNAKAQQQLREELASGGHGSDEFKAKLEDLGISLTDYSRLSTTVTQAVERENAAREEGRELVDQQAEATDGSVESAENAAEAYIAEAESVEDLSSKLSTLIETINEANGVGQDAVSANADYQQSLTDVKTQIDNIAAGTEGYARGIDLSTQAGRNNAEMLLHLAQDSQEAAQAQLDLDGNTQTYIASLQEGRQRLIDSAIAMGASEEAAYQLADQIYKIPSQKEIEILADTESAEVKLQRLKDRLDSIPGYRSVTLETITIGGRTAGIANANGNVIESYASGGIRENHVAQMAKAGAYRVWAEPETGGETYVPHHPSKRARSEQIMVETARILGGTYIPAGAQQFATGSPTGPAAPVATEFPRTVTLVVGEREFTAYIRDEAAVVQRAVTTPLRRGGRRP